MEGKKPHYHGHRERLRTRFLKTGLSGLADYEVVELLLTLAIPRRDVEEQAKSLFLKFGKLLNTKDSSAQRPPWPCISTEWDLRYRCSSKGMMR